MFIATCLDLMKQNDRHAPHINSPLIITIWFLLYKRIKMFIATCLCAKGRHRPDTYIVSLSRIRHNKTRYAVRGTGVLNLFITRHSSVPYTNNKIIWYVYRHLNTFNKHKAISNWYKWLICTLQFVYLNAYVVDWNPRQTTCWSAGRSCTNNFVPRSPR